MPSSSLRPCEGVNVARSNHYETVQLTGSWPKPFATGMSADILRLLDDADPAPGTTGGVTMGIVRDFLEERGACHPQSTGKASCHFDASLRAAFERDSAPIPTWTFRQNYHADDHLAYWFSGLWDFVNQRAALLGHGYNVSADPDFVYVDFGGATGRLSRHWHLQEPAATTITVDVTMSDVAFVCKHGMGQALHTSLTAGLPLPDASVSFLTALSVFTHMTEEQVDGHLREVARVLKPGGFAWITIHGDDTWQRMKANEQDLTRVMMAPWDVYKPPFDGPEVRINQTDWLYNSRTTIPDGVTVLTTAKENAMVWPYYRRVNLRKARRPAQPLCSSTWQRLHNPASLVTCL